MSTLPATPGAYAPSFAGLSGTYAADSHADTAICNSCHPAHFAQWQESMHAFSSFNNPFYRFSFDSFVADRGAKTGAFCAGCHDPLLLFDGKIQGTVHPSDARAHAGVTCMTCHGIRDVTPNGVGSYTLTAQAVAFPEEGDAESLAKHLDSVRPIRSEALCASCHRGFLSEDTGHPTLLSGVDEMAPWRRSAYAGPAYQDAQRVTDDTKPATCTTCHMPVMDMPAGSRTKTMHVHRFAGGHTTFASAIGSEAQLSAQRDLIKDRLHLDAFVRAEKDQWLVDVVVANLGVGHRWPGGAKDMKDTFLEVELLDAQGVVVAASGRDYREGKPERSVHRFGVEVADAQGTMIADHTVEHFRTPVYDNTIAPKDAQLVCYTFPRAGVATQVRVSVVHRRLRPTLVQETCAQAQTAKGALFLESTKLITGIAPDPCRAQPLTILAQETRALAQAYAPSWRGLYWYGVALGNVVQEKLGRAAEILEQSLRLAPAGGRDEAMVRSALADVLVRQGRYDDARLQLHSIDSLVPDHPSTHRLRGEIARRQWQHGTAAEQYARAAERAPGDDRLWGRLAESLASNERPQEALVAAQNGLALEPRDAGLLRIQALALERLGAGGAQDARAALMKFKTDEKAPGIKARCGKKDQDCYRERIPGHVHQLIVSGREP